jgi:hypothetical protein
MLKTVRNDCPHMNDVDVADAWLHTVAMIGDDSWFT